jgi:hypothetical protein
VGLTGRQWVAVLSIVVSVTGWCSLTYLLLRLQDAPGWWERIWGWLPLLLAVGVVLKGVFAFAVLTTLVRRGLATTAEVSAVLVLWGAVGAGLFGFTAWLCPVEVSRSLLAGIVVLLLPLGRCALAPLALEWNRHR